MASRFSFRASERMPWLPRLVSTLHDLLLRVSVPSLVTYPGAPCINVKKGTGRLRVTSDGSFRGRP
jgi:hypothetical protein